MKKKIVFINFILIFYLMSTNILTPVLAKTAENNVPKLINYQGYLTDQNGKALTGNYTITFSLYDDSEAGNMLWQETHDTLKVSNGLFNVLLGSNIQLTSDHFKGERYLGIQVAGESEMTPRMRLTSVAYSLKAEQVTNGMNKVHEGTCNGVNSYKISGLDGDSHKIYQIYFHGTITNNQDVYLAVRPNNDTGINFRSGMRCDGEWGGWFYPVNWGILFGRSAWKHICDLSYKLTLFCESGRERFGHGDGSMFDTNNPSTGYLMIKSLDL